MLIVKTSAELGSASRSEMAFFDAMIILLNVILFAIPLIESFMEHVRGKHC
jgi:hypothetical protein